MKNHFQKTLREFEYLMCFDLAKFETGISIIDIKDLTCPHIKDIHQISIDKNVEEPYSEFYDKLNLYFEFLKENIPLEKVLVIREKQPSGHGATTTIATLQALAGVHAILDIMVHRYNICEYEDGIHASSVKAWAREVLNLEKPQKIDIKNYLVEKYPELLGWPKITLDITDSIALAECLINRKWNGDIKELIKEKKKKIKELKLQLAKDKVQQSIEELQNKLL